MRKGTVTFKMLEITAVGQISVLTGMSGLKNFRVLILQHHVFAYHSQNCASCPNTELSQPPHYPDELYAYEKIYRESTVHYADIFADK